jgi:hypothetical protein
MMFDVPGQRAEGATNLMLRRGERGEDFYVVELENGEQVGRIFRSHAAPRQIPWCWTIDFFRRRGVGPHQGFEPTREEALAAFRNRWAAMGARGAA